MSSGFPIEIPNIGRAIVPFIPYENTDFENYLGARVRKAQELQRKYGSTITDREYLQDDINYPLVHAIVKKFQQELDRINEGKVEGPAIARELLYASGELHLLMRDARLTKYADYVRDITILLDFCRKRRIDYMGAGMDQIISRLVYVLRFEAPIANFGFFALWLEDFTTEDGSVLA